jgi:hypothetical protein
MKVRREYKKIRGNLNYNLQTNGVMRPPLHYFLIPLFLAFLGTYYNTK